MYRQSFTIPYFPKIGLTHKNNPQWSRQLSQPTLRREGDARLAGCVFHERNTRGVATNVYLRKTSEKPEKTRSTNF